MIPLPPGVNSMVTESPDGWQNIYINTSLSFIDQKQALKHELDHIAEDDFNNTRSIRDIEA